MPLTRDACLGLLLHLNNGVSEVCGSISAQLGNLKRP